MVYMYTIGEPVSDDLSPINNAEDILIETPEVNFRNFKREVGSSIINVIKDILDTFYISTKTDLKRS